MAGGPKQWYALFTHLLGEFGLLSDRRKWKFSSTSFVPCASYVVDHPSQLLPQSELNRYIKRAPVRKTQNLISGDIDEEYLKRKKWEGKSQLLTENDLISLEENNMAEDVIQILSYWKGNLTLSLVTDHSQFPDKAIPPHILKRILVPLHDLTLLDMKFDENGNYHPVVFGNEFWLLNEDLMPINDTVETLKLDMVYEPIGLVKWNFLVQMDESFSMQRVHASSFFRTYSIRICLARESTKRITWREYYWTMILTYWDLLSASLLFTWSWTHSRSRMVSLIHAENLIRFQRSNFGKTRNLWRECRFDQFM